MLPLEDLFTDIIAKAQRGLRVTDAMLAEVSGVSPAIISELKSGTINEEAILRIAPHLRLDGPRLITLARGEWHPREVHLEGLFQASTHFGGMLVNAYLVWDQHSKQAAAFDTGSDAAPLLDMIRSESLNLTEIFVTHTHPDHITDLERLSQGRPVSIHSCAAEPLPNTLTFSYGERFTLGVLTIEARKTTGHTVGGVTYVVTGLARPVAIVGDALFAGSAGGGLISWHDVLATCREEILTLPPDTIICPGHGPLTTVAEELAHNPLFLSETAR